MITDWYDLYPSMIIDDFHAIRERSFEDVRDQHKLIIGPWLHSSVGKPKQGVLSYPDAVSKPKYETKRFFDYYLLGAKNGYPLAPTIQYFQMGDDEWNDTETWYDDKQQTIELFLHPNGKLEREPMPVNIKEVPPDTIIYDPKDPSPTFGGCRLAPRDSNDAIGPQEAQALDAVTGPAGVADLHHAVTVLDLSLRVEVHIQQVTTVSIGDRQVATPLFQPAIELEFH